ncbi:MAG: family 10 glycosylhydrolase [Candidatus Margulisbacteria bacterium]|jgi:uncharacterized lipoprotein YddW (UPF0748 family)|nr:family 10 glycosylhydrolase [Candidatus Margulisiibacteriota bacterium]
MRKLICWFCLWTFALAAAPDPETRAMWVTRFELADPANIPLLVQRAASANFNTLFVQVCGRGTAFYDSQILPRDTRAVNYDALALVLAEAQKRKISVHAWINTLYVWSDKTPPVSPRHVVNAHPEWIMTVRGDNNKYLDPAIPAVRDFVKSIYLEVARNYAVDGVHLDYVRYPGPGAGFTAYSRQTFERLAGVDPLALYQNKEIARRLFGAAEHEQQRARWDSYRQDAVNTLVRAIFRELTAAAPGVILTAAVLPDPELARKNNFQDWAAWMRGGYIDAVIPMVYDRNVRTVQRQISRAAELSDEYGIPVLIGLGAWRRTAEAVIADVEFVRRLGAELGYKYLQGIVLFSYDGIKDLPNYLDDLRQNIFSRRTPLPPPREKRHLTEEAAGGGQNDSPAAQELLRKVG